MKFVIPVSYTAISSVTFSCIIESTCVYTHTIQVIWQRFCTWEWIEGWEGNMYVLVQWRFCVRFQFLEFIEAKFSPSFHFAVQLYLPIPLKEPKRFVRLTTLHVLFFWNFFIAAWKKNENFKEGHQTRTSRWSGITQEY